MRTLPVLFLITLSIPVSSNRLETTRSGSIIVCIVGNTYVVCVADSQITDMTHGNKHSLGCKLIALGQKTLFEGLGHEKIGFGDGRVWDTFQTAKRVYRNATDKSAESLANDWTQSTSDWLKSYPPETLQQLLPKHPRDPSNSEGIADAVFVGFDESYHPFSYPYVQTRHILFDRDSGKLFSRIKNTEIGTAGESIATGIEEDAAAAFTQGKINGRNLQKDMNLAISAVQYVFDHATGDEKDELGPPIDVGVLTSDGITWPEGKRKPSCYAQDLKEDPPKKQQPEKKK